MFKTRIGPLKVFEQGEFHIIKGFKVAVCSYQIESRKVLARDNLKVQTTPIAVKNQISPLPEGEKNPMFYHENPSGRQLAYNSTGTPQASFMTGKGSYLDSTLNTRTPSYPDNHTLQKLHDSNYYEGMSSMDDMKYTFPEDSNESLLQEVMKEIEELEFKTGRIDFSTDSQFEESRFQQRNQMVKHEHHQPANYYGPPQKHAPDQVYGEKFAEHRPPDQSPHGPAKAPAKGGPLENAWLRQIDSEDPPLLLWSPDQQEERD
jgi:hypothetical protein